MTDRSLVSAVWKAILRAQRPVQCWEVAEALPHLTHSQRAPALNVAYRLGYIEREGEPLHYRYSVTPRCNVPPGVQVLEIMEATA